MQAAKMLTRDEARRIAPNIAKHVHAKDEETPLALAIEEHHKIRPADQKRLFARPR
jgi:hypothetical protein